ncbi:hypothetical protein ACFYO2_40860 [Streptomyces sp. NPDC006602]|uniref:hypothetical protein n=1 Tax=Streptomyces sp. NPDC006602 TaxID=3364751 RepID=UPI00368D1112
MGPCLGVRDDVLHHHTAAIAAAHRTVVLEGCDGAGKSTLATRLAREHGFTVIHCPRTPDSVNLLQRYQTLLARPGRLVLDRCFLSELAYGPLYCSGSRITWDEARTLAKSVANWDGVFLDRFGSLDGCDGDRLPAPTLPNVAIAPRKNPTRR